MAVPFAYQKLLIPPAFRGTHALIWAQQLSGLFRVCVIMTPGFASAAPRKFSIWGEGGLLAKNEKGTGKPKVRKYAVSGHGWVSRGKGKSRRLEERADPGPRCDKADRGLGKGSWSSNDHCPCPLPTARANAPNEQPGACLLANSSGEDPFAQGPS